MLKKTLAIILTTVFLSAVMTVLIFRVFSVSVFADMKLDDMKPRSYFLANRASEYMQGFITRGEFESAFVSDRKLWDAEPYIYNTDGELIAWSAFGDYQENTTLISKYLSGVLSGGEVALYTLKSKASLIVGTPITNIYGVVIGAAFLVKPLIELNSTVWNLVKSLGVSMLAVLAVMILPAYISSRRLTRPLATMKDAALAMARGDFSVKADDRGRDEVAQLGHSLNELSGALSENISALTFERNRLKSILFGLGEGVIAVNEHGRIMQHNPASERLLGAEDGDIEENPLFLSLAEKIDAVLYGEGTHTEEAEEARGELTLRFTITPLVSGQAGEVEGALILIQDVTEAVRLEQTRRDYVANVSHELRTPIASIRSLSDALTDGLIKKDEDKARYYGYIQRESIRLSRLIDDLLELSRLQSGAVALNKRKLDVRDLLMDVAERYSAAARDAGFALELSVPDEPRNAYTNPDRAEQVLIALLDNAMKHNDGAGNIELSAKEADGRFIISVSNSGSIAKADIDHLFERFYKADKSHSGEGTGLGLAISKEIMDLLGERIWVESRSGRVTFFFTLSYYEKEK